MSVIALIGGYFYEKVHNCSHSYHIHYIIHPQNESCRKREGQLTMNIKYKLLKPTVALVIAGLLVIGASPLTYAKKTDDDKEEYTFPLASYTLTLPESPKELTLSVKQAVDYGLLHNPDMRKLNNEVDYAKTLYLYSDANKSKLSSSQKRISDANTQIAASKSALSAAKSDLQAAQTLVNNGVTPVTVPVTDGGGNPILDGSGNQIILYPGQGIKASLVANGLDDTTATALTTGIIASIQSGLDANALTISQNEVALTEAETTLNESQVAFSEGLETASAKIDEKLANSVPTLYSADDAGKLLITMSGIQFELTRYAKPVYENQMAMLIQKEFYDALAYSKIVTLKETALERAEIQFDMMQLSFENGMKSKEDFLLAQMYLKSCQSQLTLAQKDYDNSLYALKHTLNLDMDCELNLIEPNFEEPTVPELDLALQSGLVKRLEVQKALGTLTLYKLDLEMIQKRGYQEFNKYAEDEAIIKVAEAELALEKNLSQVSKEIHESYENVEATRELYQITQGLLEDAQEVVAISELKYQQGFGAENALLASLNLDASSGTFVEVIAAKEKEAEIEAQVAQIKYNYQMATIKYLNDAALLEALED